MFRKVILDTNVFVDYLRAGLHADWVAGRVAGTVRFLSALVLMELRLGADTPRRARAVDRVRAAYPDSRLVAPLPETYERAGTLFRRVWGVRGAGDRLGRMNDLLIALSAWRIGATVVTGNTADFRAVSRHLPGLQFVAPA
jgi:predicted nucleic acid-binding protein